MLHLFTNPHTPAAKNTFRRITDNSLAGIVDFSRNGPTAELPFGYIQLCCQFLKFAPPAAVARQAAVIMIGQQQFKNGFPGPDDPRGMSEYLHPMLNMMRTRRDQVITPLRLNHTNPAGTGRPEAFHTAERGNINAIFTERIDDQFAFPCPDLSAVYFDLYQNPDFINLPK
jgi:hypothetical protein